MRFLDRGEAGQRLAERMTAFADREDVIVLGLPRGGVPVAAALAERLHLPLDAVIVRKLGLPGHEELAMGAIAEGGVEVTDERTLESFGVPRETVARVAADERFELARRERAYRGTRPPVPLTGRTVLLVDDGLATGASMRAAVRAVRDQGAARIVVAVPVAPPEVANALASSADEVVCLSTPSPFYAVGAWYDDFTPTTDAEVRALLAPAAPSHVQ
ncbi:MAG: phosphoribosyltransferase [Gemmatimonadaceae bacterium]|nr:phosphoribosyltransferase [Gemmatimonadaceae bacterium]